jgi:hypothetical protein
MIPQSSLVMSHQSAITTRQSAPSTLHPPPSARTFTTHTVITPYLYPTCPHLPLPHLTHTSPLTHPPPTHRYPSPTHPQVKRATPASSATAKIRLAVDPTLCPGRHRFELQVTPVRTYLTASDNTGLLYGLYCFIQLLQLHSQVKIYGDGVTAIELPPVTITDWPDLPQRAVLWSYRLGAQTGFGRMRDNVELFSRLRLNVLMLVVDTVSEVEAAREEADLQGRGKGWVDGVGGGEGTVSTSASSSAGSAGTSASTSATVGSDPEEPTAISALDEICANLCVELVPTIVLNSVFERLPMAVLKSFSHSTITLVFTFDLRTTRAAIEEKDSEALTSSGDAICEVECRRCIEAVMDAVLSAGTPLVYSTRCD